MKTKYVCFKDRVLKAQLYQVLIHCYYIKKSPFLLLLKCHCDHTYFSTYTYYKHLLSILAFMVSKFEICGKLISPLFNFINWGVCHPFCINSFSFFSLTSLLPRGAGKLQGRDSSSCPACTETSPDHFGSCGTQYLLFSKSDN